ncbi:MAG: N-acetylmuramoyl-L-alanine amidase [Pseudomonadota bacterium]
MRHCPSPNFGPRRDNLEPTIVVIHYTAMQSAEAALARLCDPEAEVSAHYLIARDGIVTRMVEEAERAWHAGAGEWRGLQDINSRSIGIELDNPGDCPFPEPQMAALEALLTEICVRWRIAPEDVIGHSDMAPGRKCDPGPRFDWARLARQGLAGPTQAAATTGDFVTQARSAGFTADVDPDTLLSAVRLRFAPWREGPLTDADAALFHRI